MIVHTTNLGGFFNTTLECSRNSFYPEMSAFCPSDPISALIPLNKIVTTEKIDYSDPDQTSASPLCLNVYFKYLLNIRISGFHTRSGLICTLEIFMFSFRSQMSLLSFQAYAKYM